MRYDLEENLARRSVPSPPFDCELPPAARAEMLKPKRPVILDRPVYQPPQRFNILKWGSSILVVVLLVVNAISTHQQNAGVTKQQSAPVVQPTPAPVVQPTPAQPVSRPPGPPPPAVSAPRARLVRLPSPPLRLIELTPEHIDESHRITMPYGTEVLATLRGFLENENQLPRIGRIGDMYVVGNVPWIWIRVPGTTAPTWVDP